MDKKITRREILKAIGSTLLFSIVSSRVAGAEKTSNFVAVRIWPASAYTRVTIESQRPLDYKYFHLQNPDRLVLDIQNVQLDEVIKSISSKILAKDPYISKARVGQYDENTVRIVFDLKEKINPQLFTLQPVAEFQNRLVIDLYPHSVRGNDDPLLALLQEYNKGEVSKYGSTDSNPIAKDVIGDKISEITGDSNLTPSPVIVADNKTPPIFTQPVSKSVPTTVKLPLEPTTEPEKTVSKSTLKSTVVSQPETKSTSKPNSTVAANPSASKNKNKSKSNKDIIVVLDPGHGGEDPGATGSQGTREKDVVLNIARKARTELKNKGFKVYMTRDEDVFIPLRVRVAKARQLKAHIFVSIHADAFTKPSARGTGVFALSQKGATSEAAKYLAKTNNQADEIGGVKKVGDKNVDNTLFDLTQTATINRSLKLGDFILTELGKVNKLHKKYVDQANFAVLKAPDIPSVLVESAFISNPIEEGLLRMDSFRMRMAQSISAGVSNFAGTILV